MGTLGVGGRGARARRVETDGGARNEDVTTSAVTTRVVSTWLFRLNGVYPPF